MKLRKELLNGMLITAGVGAYFLLMEALGLSDIFFLRILNIFIVLYGVNRTLKSNIEEGKNEYLENIKSGGLTAFIGVILSVIGLRIYIAIRGGDAYIKSLSDVFLFGNNPTENEYCLGVLFEASASAVIGTFILMQYWRRHIVSD